MKSGIVDNCLVTSVVNTIGPMVPSGAAAGSFVNNIPNSWFHVNQWDSLHLGWNKFNSGGTAATVVGMAAEFLADSGSPTVFANAINVTTTPSTTAYWPVLGGVGSAAGNTSELTAAIPIPFAGTLSLFSMASATVPTANLVATVRVNGVSPANGPSVTVFSTDATPFWYLDNVHTASVTADQYIDVQVASGATTQTVPQSYYVVFTPASGTANVIAGMIASTAGASANFSLPMSKRTSATAANAKMTMPVGCVISHLDVVQATANGAGVTTTFTIQDNGVDSVVTGTIASGNGTGVIQVDNTHSFTIAQGHTLSLKYVTGSGTSGVIGGWSVQCQP
jgi:hypothetical protein